MSCTHNIFLRETDIVKTLLFPTYVPLPWAQTGTHPVDMHTAGSIFMGIFHQTQRVPRQDAMKEEAH